MLTYNHGPYLAQAIESVLNQQTKYPFELIICDDASTDGAREIAIEYAKKDPRVVLSLQDENTRFTKNFIDGCSHIKGKYLAFCEGDDYWTDTEKLEKQVSFLEEHPDFTVCAHRVQILSDSDRQPQIKDRFIYKDCSSDEGRIRDGIFYPDEAIANYYFQTGSLVLRWRFRKGFPPWFRKRMMFDHFMFMLHAAEGKIKYFDEVMSVWRRHESGYTWLQTQDKGLFFQKEGTDWIQMYQYMDNFFSKRFTLQIDERINLALRSMVKNCLETGNIDNLRWLTSIYQAEFAKALRNKDLLDAWRIAKPDDEEFVPPWSSPRAGTQLPKPHDNSPSCALPPLAIADIPPVQGSIWDIWVGDRPYGEFFNLRSALCAWLWHKNISTIWIPVYSPPSLSQTLYQCQYDYKIYNTNSELDPDHEFLTKLKPCEAVLLIEYLGRPISPAFQNEVVKRPEIHWLIDRAQSLAADRYPGGEAYFYSPSKLIGVPDGGLVVWQEQTDLSSPGHDGLNHEAESLLRCSLEGANADGATLRTAWLKYQERHKLSKNPMSRSTRLLLERIPWLASCEKRIHNWRLLFAELGDYCLWGLAEPEFAPFAFPFLCPEHITCEIFHTLLERNGISCQRMWFPLAIAKSQFPIEEALAKRLLLLPLSPVLDDDFMHKICTTVKNILNDKGLANLRTITF